MDYRRKQEGYINQLIAYIKKNMAKGYTAESLKWALVGQGYAKIEVEKAIAQANRELASQAPKFVEKPIIKVEAEPIIEQEKGFFSRIKSWFE